MSLSLSSSRNIQQSDEKSPTNVVIFCVGSISAFSCVRFCAFRQKEKENIILKNFCSLFLSLLLLKKYWPKYINGDDIKEHFEDKPIGHCDAMQGELENIKCTVMLMKESDYVMMIMSTYGTIEQVGEMKHRTLADNTRISFKYPEVFFNHYKYRHCVDDNNNRRQSPISIEKT